MTLLFKPRGAWAADVIPFFWAGDYHLFYLRDARDRERSGEGTPWAHLVTRDFVHYEELPDALLGGGPDDQDRWTFTGCVIEREGTFHIFYTGHNAYLRGTERPSEAIMHATSPDLVAWTVDPVPVLLPDRTRYEPDDWRDPFVCWNEERGEYWMLLAARDREGPQNRRGVTVFATSPDLGQWAFQGPFWAPGLYHTHECPDLFREGGRWYLVYSEFTDRICTRYRVADTLDGPWRVIGEDSFDGRAFYAAKTASDGERRFAFGWLPTKLGEHDAGEWQWGGQIVVHELRVRPDASLAVAAPREVVAAFDEAAPLDFAARRGSWAIEAPDRARVDAGDGFAWARLGAMPRTCLIEATVTFDDAVADLGLLLRTNDDLGGYYRVRLEIARSRVILDRWQGPIDQPFVMERPLDLRPGVPVRIRVIADGSALIAYVDDEAAISTRGYDFSRGSPDPAYVYRGVDAGLFVSSGTATFADLRIRTRASG